jgi:hypothetical protein
MRNEYSPQRENIRPYLFVSLVICSSVVCVLFFVIGSSWYSVLWIVPVMSEVSKKGARMGPTFSSPIVSLTLYVPSPALQATTIHFVRGQNVCLFLVTWIIQNLQMF